ncbi:MAG: ketopantoate reductase family protein [Candidatus Dormibacteria bacterium]
MRFAVVGAGATGGLVGAHLTRAGEKVTLIARGAHLRAMQARGLRVVGLGQDFQVEPPCTDDLAAVGEAETVLLTVKAHSLPTLMPQLAPLLKDGTLVVAAQNGIPWWFFQGWGGALQGTVLEAVDPGGGIAHSLQRAHVAGAVVYPAARVREPGVIEHQEGWRISLGDPAGGKPDDLRLLSAALTAAGFRAPVVLGLRAELWLKLLGTASLNPISALTGATLQEITADHDASWLARSMMEEVQLIGTRLGIQLPVGVERRLRGAAAVGEHKTSMLQDVEARRPMEVEAALGALVELADRLRLGVPNLRVVLACTRVLDRRLRQRPT